jgi:hypothetical protein
MSVQPFENIPVTVDYTNRDYFSIRDVLIERIKARIPEWTASDPADFGVALVEAFAYMGDIIAYYIDRAANESFIETAVQRSTLLRIAGTYGYTPSGFRQASVNLQFTNLSDENVTVPAGTVVSGELTITDTIQTVYFTTVADCLVDANSFNTVFALEGRPVTIVADNANQFGELVGTSTGLPNMEFVLGEVPVAEGTVEVYVQSGSSFTKWTEVPNIIDYGPTDLVYTTFLDENDIVSVRFGDSVSGVIPTLFSEIRVNYVVGGGVVGNIPINTLNTLFYIPGLSEEQTTALQAAVIATNTEPAVGGSDAESNDQVRVSAPETLRALNRAITLQDFERLALSLRGIGKSKATASVWTSVALYISPSRNPGDIDPSPGLDSNGDPTSEFQRLQEELETFLEDKLLIGTTVTVSPPIYTDLVLELEYTKLPQYTTEEVENEIKRAIFSAFGYVNMKFGDEIPPQYVEFVILQVPGVRTAQVVILDRADADTPDRTTVVGDPGEIFRFVESGITLTNGEA